MKHQGTKTIETERLLLRQLQVEDAKAMFNNWAKDDEVTRFLTWPAHQDVSMTETVLRQWQKSYQEDSFYQWGIVYKSSQELIGSISVVSVDDRVQSAQIGYCIGKKWWHKGITTEALQAIMKFLFDEVGVNRIEARFDPRNVYSGAVMKKCGMNYEGTHKQADYNNQGICDVSYYALLASENKEKMNILEKVPV